MDTSTQQEQASRAAGPEGPAAPDPQAPPPLTDDLAALLDDGRLYLEAEMAFQKSRVSYAAGQGKSGLAMGVAALALIHLALIALAVGLVIALSPYLSPIGATVAVAFALLVLAFLLGLGARKRFGGIARAFAKDQQT